KIVHLTMGNPNGNFKYETRLIALEDAQIRHNALEAARMATNKFLEEKLGGKEYFLKILVYPHHVLREHKIMTGAGADRLSEGMRRAFGRPAGLAARVKKGQNIMILRTAENGLSFAKEALTRGASKMPIPTRIDVITL
ncbi:50S ribosomal protein L16, partial [Candidatus Bathyarchaeota archaeon]|nr:50S ribosomal protein L16 [Candidatus Bathyarchaeota archaeon]